MDYNTCDKQLSNQMENNMNNAIEVPKLSSRALEVKVLISAWTAVKKKKGAARQVAAQNNMGDIDALNVSTNVLQGCESLTDIHTLKGEMRKYNYSKTLPWTDKGGRILMTAEYPAWVRELTAKQAEFDRLFEVFISEYEFQKIAAQQSQGDLFDERDYPPVEVVREKFGCRLSVMPIVDAGDWRLDVEDDAQGCFDELIATHTSAAETRINAAMADIHKRLHKVLANMSDRLDYVGDKDKKTFRGTLLDNVLDIVELMRTCNLTNDTQLTAQADTLERALRGVSCGALRDSSHLRAETKRTVDEVIASLPSIDL